MGRVGEKSIIKIASFCLKFSFLMGN